MRFQAACPVRLRLSTVRLNCQPPFFALQFWKSSLSGNDVRREGRNYWKTKSEGKDDESENHNDGVSSAVDAYGGGVYADEL